MFVLTRLTCSFSMVLDFSSVQFQSDLYYGGAASALSVRKGALRSGAAAGNPDSGTVCVLADGPLSSSFPRQFWFARRLPAASRRTRADMLARRGGLSALTWWDFCLRCCSWGRRSSERGWTACRRSSRTAWAAAAEAAARTTGGFVHQISQFFNTW